MEFVLPLRKLCDMHLLSDEKNLGKECCENKEDKLHYYCLLTTVKLQPTVQRQMQLD